MTITVNLDEQIAQAGKERAGSLKGRGQRKRYNFSAYLEELIEMDAIGPGILPDAIEGGTGRKEQGPRRRP